MIIKYLKSILKLTSVIFTIIILFQLITKQELNNSILYGLLGLSLVFSLIKFIINKYIISEDSIFNSVSYIIIVWLMVISSNYLFNWNMSLSSMFSSFIEVILIYICVRFINYQHERTEVKKMNEILDRNRKNKQQ
jgi:hypothetical protein